MRRMYSKPQLLEAVEQESKLNGIKVFENIVDKDGHPRFIEGDGTVEEISGVTSTFCKYSLSGSHIMFVFAGNFASGTSLSSGTLLCSFKVPKWIYDKIYTVWQNYINAINFTTYSETWATANANVSLRKHDNVIDFYTISSYNTGDSGKRFRFAFDLLIDNN